MRRSPFSDRALIALRLAGTLDDRELARRMQLARPTSVMAELDQLQLVKSWIHDRTTRPWTWRYELTAAGELEAQRAIEAAAADESARAQRLADADRGTRAAAARGHW